MFKFPNSPVFYRDLDRAYSEVVRGEGIYLYDRSGKQYIDGSGEALVVNIGHGRTAVAEAMSRQASQVAYTHGTHFTTEVLEHLSATLANLLPGDLDKVYLVPGGRRQWKHPSSWRGSTSIAEPVIGAAAGAAVPPPEYFPRVREICNRHGILLIADEVMTGFGRTGR